MGTRCVGKRPPRESEILKTRPAMARSMQQYGTVGGDGVAGSGGEWGRQITMFVCVGRLSEIFHAEEAR
eukprot:ctg_185.g75